MSSRVAYSERAALALGVATIAVVFAVGYGVARWLTPTPPAVLRVPAGVHDVDGLTFHADGTVSGNWDPARSDNWPRSPTITSTALDTLAPARDLLADVRRRGVGPMNDPKHCKGLGDVERHLSIHLAKRLTKWLCSREALEMPTREGDELVYRNPGSGSG